MKSLILQIVGTLAPPHALAFSVMNFRLAFVFVSNISISIRLHDFGIGLLHGRVLRAYI